MRRLMLPYVTNSLYFFFKKKNLIKKTYYELRREFAYEKQNQIQNVKRKVKKR